MREPRDEEPPLPPVSPAAAAPSRLRRTLHSLRAPFRPGSPFHIGGSHKRSGSNKSSVSDGDLARDERTMRKRNKKTRDPPADATRSIDTLPSTDKKKKDGFIRKMGSLTRKKVGESGSASSSQSGTKESTLESISPPPEAQTSTPESSATPTSIPATPTPQTPTSTTSTPVTPTTETSVPETAIPEAPSVALETKPSEPAPEPRSPSPSAQPSEPVSPIAVTHPVATRPFTKAAWKRNSEPEIEKPVEEPSPGSALRRRIAFVAQASAEEGEGEGEGDGGRGGVTAVGSLEEAVALAREKLGGPAPPSSPHAREQRSEDEMPPTPRPVPAPYGDLIEPASKPGTAPPVSVVQYKAVGSQRGGPRTAPHAASAGGSSERCARAMSMTFEEAVDDCYLTVCDCCGFSAETTVFNPSHASPSAERREHLYKILVIGELGTGKTSIIKRYVHQFFSQHYRATIGVDFALKVLNWDANTIIRLQLWDIAGQERFGNMTRVYYKEAVGAFIVFDVSRLATFDAVVKWKNDLDAKVQLPDGSPIPCILLANKCDQQKEGIVNSPAKMEEYCREKGFAGWFETSAKENINIEEAARSLVNKILLNDKLLQSNDRDGDKFALEHKIANGENSRDSAGKSCNC